MSHTPGPYIKVEQKINDEIHICIRQEIALGKYIAWVSKNTGNDEDNANLFVAAPDLLAACEAVKKDQQAGRFLSKETLDLIYDAIEKSKGE